MKQAKAQLFLPLLVAMAIGLGLFNACAGAPPKPVPMSPAQNPNGQTSSKNSQDGGKRGSAARDDQHDDQHDDNGDGNNPPPGPPAGPQQSPNLPTDNGGPAKCSSNYALGYGDPYQENNQGPWLAKNKTDYTDTCQINVPTCNGDNGQGYGAKFPHGKLCLAKNDNVNFADASVCIIEKLNGNCG